MTRRKTACRILLVTAPDKQTCLVLANAAIDARLAACVTQLGVAESTYVWKGKKESTNEIVLLFKTTKSATKSLIELLRSHHPYDCPEIIAIDIQDGYAPYLKWIGEKVDA